MLKGHGRYGALSSSKKPVRRGRDSERRYVAKASRYSKEEARSNISLRSMISNYELGAMDGILPSNRMGDIKICRDIFKYDTVSGAAVELMSNLPFSSFNLTGVNDKKILSKYVKSVEALKMTTLFPYLSRDYLTDGAFTASFIWDDGLGIFTDVIPHDNLNIETHDIPIYGYDPLLSLRVPEQIQMLKSGKMASDPRVKKILEKLPKFLIEADSKSQVLLDPNSTLYIARKSFSFDSVGVSYLNRIIPLWLIEKALLRGSIEQAYQRQRPITHITAGTDEWEATDDQLSQIAQFFVNANMDPTGAVVATRPDINVSEVIRGDDFYKHCLSEGTLVPTENGLMRIEDMSSINKSPMKILGGEGEAEATIWHKTGRKRVFAYTTRDGQRIESTNLHRYMVLNENLDLEWKFGKDLKKGDLLSVSSKPMKRKKKLKIGNFAPTKYGNEGDIKFPKEMSTKLAYVLGLFIAEGWSSKYTVQFGNADSKLLKGFEENMQSLFGLTPSRTLVEAGCDSGGITSTLDFHDLKYCRKQLVEFFDFLGVKQVTAKFKQVPWSILQADYQSQLAFLAGYVEGDGFIRHDTMGICSSSPKLLNEVQSLAGALGFISHIKRNTLTFNREAAYSLNNELYPYLNSKTEEIAKPITPIHAAGIPTEFIYKFVESRKRGRKRGVVIENDKGELIEINNFNVFNRQIRKTWTVSGFLEGEYNVHLDIIDKISPALHKKILSLFRRQFHFCPIENIEYVRIAETYDLTMKDGFENSFVAGGIVVHNSDVYDYLAQAKLRALNISDSFLSGDATFTTLEVALSVFMEQIRQFRSSITRELFYDKLFPSIAFANNFKKSKRDLQVAGSFGTKIIQTKSGYKAICDGSSLHDITSIKDITEYHIPKVEWHKQLAPQSDREYIDLLGSMREHGIPIPIRMMASAAGLNLDTIMSMLDDDLETRETLSEHMKEISKLSGGDEEGGGGLGFASLINGATGKAPERKSRIQELAETEGFEVSERHKNGKRRYARPKYQKQLEERNDKKLAAALGRIARGDISASKVARSKGKKLLKNDTYGKPA